MGLREDQIHRYSRHILLAEIGGEGQQRLLDAVAIVRGEGRGPEEAAIYLAAAGVGHLRLAPALHRKISGRLRELNPDAAVTVAVAMTGGSAETTTPPGAIEVIVSAPDRRAAGAMAALSALITLSGAAPEHHWILPETTETSPWI